MEKLKKSGLKKLPRTGRDARFLRRRGDKSVLGYPAGITVSDDHLMAALRVTQNATGNSCTPCTRPQKPIPNPRSPNTQNHHPTFAHRHRFPRGRPKRAESRCSAGHAQKPLVK
jgi:hypothetical protein